MEVAWHIDAGGYPGKELWTEPPRRIWEVLATVFPGRLFSAIDEDYRVAGLIDTAEGCRNCGARHDNLSEWRSCLLVKLRRERPVTVSVVGRSSTVSLLRDNPVGSEQLQHEIEQNFPRDNDGRLSLTVTEQITDGCRLVAEPATGVVVDAAGKLCRVRFPMLLISITSANAPVKVVERKWEES